MSEYFIAPFTLKHRSDSYKYTYTVRGRKFLHVSKLQFIWLLEFASDAISDAIKGEMNRFKSGTFVTFQK